MLNHTLSNMGTIIAAFALFGVIIGVASGLLDRVAHTTPKKVGKQTKRSIPVSTPRAQAKQVPKLPVELKLAKAKVYVLHIGCFDTTLGTTKLRIVGDNEVDRLHRMWPIMESLVDKLDGTTAHIYSTDGKLVATYGLNGKG